MTLKKLSYLLWIVAFACTPARRVHISTTNDQLLQSYIDSVGNSYAPDKRTTWFRVTASNGVVKGETNSVAAKQALIAKLNATGLGYTDSVQVLPLAELGSKTKGIITLSVANIRVQPSHRAELTTQATMGTPVAVWKRERGWYLVQTPDQYLGWLDSEALVLKDPVAYNNWFGLPKLIFTAPYGFAYDRFDHSATITDLVYGDVLAAVNDSGSYINVMLPDGRSGSVLRSQCMYYSLWKRTRDPLPDSIVGAARKLMGVPYLWGGTSFKGVDCSGFTKTVYFMNGLILPRDAYQQAMMGSDVNTDKGWDELRPGDLLFFGSAATANSPERVVHVGIWIGQGEFIHASGKVQIASLDPAATNYDAGEHKRFLKARRFLNDSSLFDLRRVQLYE